LFLCLSYRVVARVFLFDVIGRSLTLAHDGRRGWEAWDST
jgi:hypothetical protein